MRRPMRFTLRRIMILVALVGLNLAAGLATSKFYPRPQLPLGVIVGERGGYISDRLDGIVEYGRYGFHADGSYWHTMTRVKIRPPRPALLRIWFPMIASVTASLLVMIGPAMIRAARRRGGRTRPDSLI